MANLKNKKPNAAKKTAAAAPVQSAQSAAASKDAVKVATPNAVETKAAETKATGAKEESNAAQVEAAPKKEEAASTKAAEAKKPVARKNVEKKTAVKKPGRKVQKKAEAVQETFFEYAGEQILAEELVNRIKETYKSEGHRIGAIKSLRVYINPEDRKAYYVINDKAEGKYVEF